MIMLSEAGREEGMEIARASGMPDWAKSSRLGFL